MDETQASVYILESNQIAHFDIVPHALTPTRPKLKREKPQGAQVPHTHRKFVVPWLWFSILDQKVILLRTSTLSGVLVA
jgi:hypothetical protein